VEHGCLGCRVFAQLGHLVDATFDGLFLFSLVPAFCLVPLFLLPCLFFLALRKRGSASWHICLPNSLLSWRTGSVDLGLPDFSLRRILPAWFARLTRVATIIIATATPTATTKALTAATGPVSFGFRLVDRQRAAAQFASIQRSDSLISFTGIGHFYKRKAPRSSRIPVRHKADLLNGAMRLENIAQFSLGCAVG
jgi:hypothetical protein